MSSVPFKQNLFQFNGMYKAAVEHGKTIANNCILKFRIRTINNRWSNIHE